MDRYQAIVAVASIIFGSLTVISVAFAVALGVGRWRRGGALHGDTVLTRLDQRMDRMEQAIDAVAVEVERVAEGQRFATRLLADRSAEPRRET